MLVYCSVLLIHIRRKFDRVYLRLAFSLILFSEVTDILWMALYSSRWWNPASITENPTLMLTYQRLCVAIVVFLMIGKIFLAILLIPLRNIENYNFRVKVGDNLLAVVEGRHRTDGLVSQAVRQVFKSRALANSEIQSPQIK